MNRICPSEEVLSGYLSGVLPEEDKNDLETHLCKCKNCRILLADSYHITKGPDAGEIRRKVSGWINKNKWLLAASISFVLSFAVPRYFLQFLAAFVILGAKWAIDAKSAKTLIMISEAWKRGDKKKTEEIISRFTPKK